MRSEQFGNFIAGFAAGVLDDPLAYWLVRGAGSIYGLSAWADVGTPPGPLEYLGDSVDSVRYINYGVGFGYYTYGQYQ